MDKVNVITVSGTPLGVAKKKEWDIDEKERENRAVKESSESEAK